MKNAMFLACFTIHAAAFAGIDQPWKEPLNGGGAIPGIALVAGLLGAAWAGWHAVNARDSLGNVALTAWYGFIFGVLVGLPVSCILK